MMLQVSSKVEITPVPYRYSNTMQHMLITHHIQGSTGDAIFPKAKATLITNSRAPSLL
jgi:hypothetical protein